MSTLTINGTTVKEWLWLLAHWRYRFWSPGPITIRWLDGTETGPLPTTYQGVQRGNWKWEATLTTVPEQPPEDIHLGTVPPRCTLGISVGPPPFTTALTPLERRWLIPLQIFFSVYINAWFLFQSITGDGFYWWLAAITWVVWLAAGPWQLWRAARLWKHRAPADAPILLATRISDDPAERTTEQLTPTYRGFWQDPDRPPVHYWTVRMRCPHTAARVECKALRLDHMCDIRWADGMRDGWAAVETAPSDEPELRHATWSD